MYFACCLRRTNDLPFFTSQNWIGRGLGVKFHGSCPSQVHHLRVPGVEDIRRYPPKSQECGDPYRPPRSFIPNYTLQNELLVRFYIFFSFFYSLHRLEVFSRPIEREGSEAPRSDVAISSMTKAMYLSRGSTVESWSTSTGRPSRSWQDLLYLGHCAYGLQSRAGRLVQSSARIARLGTARLGFRQRGASPCRISTNFQTELCFPALSCLSRRSAEVRSFSNESAISNKSTDGMNWTE
ncbi:unnamed protein product [Nesidiocoris tenuis]|uniref:Uncharacterized protein n=1 Tax=Nesidiocoris tenuis TaxID=355587 RepID=A0A6H5HFZ3_9HEMI|nr:unnamed protein product [Nesidiocoris tenuis]